MPGFGEPFDGGQDEGCWGGGFGECWGADDEVGHGVSDCRYIDLVMLVDRLTGSPRRAGTGGKEISGSKSLHLSSQGATV